MVSSKNPGVCNTEKGLSDAPVYCIKGLRLFQNFKNAPAWGIKTKKLTGKVSSEEDFLKYLFGKRGGRSMTDDDSPLKKAPLRDAGVFVDRTGQETLCRPYP